MPGGSRTPRDARGGGRFMPDHPAWFLRQIIWGSAASLAGRCKIFAPIGRDRRARLAVRRRARWTRLAAETLQRVARRIRQDNPAAARQVAKTLYDSSMSLETMPNRGRSGRIADTREFVHRRVNQTKTFQLK